MDRFFASFTALVLILMAGCASSPATPVQTSTSTTSVVAPSPIAPAPSYPAPLVGHCDILVSSVGAVSGSARSGNCALKDAIPASLVGTRSLLMEVTWDALQPSILALKSSIEWPTCPAGTAIPPQPCPGLASNDSMIQPVRITFNGEEYTKVADEIAGFVNVYQGAAAQQPVTITFSAFVQATVPGNFSAVKV